MFLEAPEIQGIIDQSLLAPDVARATLEQMSEISRNTQATGIFLGTAAIESPRDTSVDQIETPHAQVFDTNPRLDIPLFNIASKNPRITIPENSQNTEGEMVLPMHGSPPALDVDHIAAVFDFGRRECPRLGCAHGPRGVHGWTSHAAWEQRCWSI
jgi:hypothetical protein